MLNETLTLEMINGAVWLVFESEVCRRSVRRDEVVRFDAMKACDVGTQLRNKVVCRGTSFETIVTEDEWRKRMNQRFESAEAELQRMAELDNAEILK